MCEATLLAAVVAAYPEISWERVADIYPNLLAISKITPMKSNAGHYLGRYCTEMVHGKPTFLEPFTRETEYYSDKETLLKLRESGVLTVRDCLENNALYSSGILPYPDKL